jgi:hypothetical protein
MFQRRFRMPLHLFDQIADDVSARDDPWLPRMPPSTRASAANSPPTSGSELAAHLWQRFAAHLWQRFGDDDDDDDE